MGSSPAVVLQHNAGGSTRVVYGDCAVALAVVAQRIVRAALDEYVV